jgi:hypothetical protein
MTNKRRSARWPIGGIRWKAAWIEGLLLAILVTGVSVRVWGLGLTHTDDAVWALRAHQSAGGFFTREPIGAWALTPGRFWAHVSGAWMLHTLQWQGTAYGEVLRLGSFTAFFAVFHVTVRAFFGHRIALLASTFAAGLAMVRWDGSILTTYPLITWPAGAAFGLALLAGRRYVQSAGAGWSIAGALLLFFSLMNNEGVTVLFMLLSVLAAWQLRELDARRGARWLLTTLIACAAYAALYFGWRLMHPSSYQGHVIAPFELRSWWLTFGHFSTGGNVLHDVVTPYRVAYADAQEVIAVQAVYRIREVWPGLLRSPTAMAAGVVAGLLVHRALRPSEDAAAAGSQRAVIVSGLLIATVTVLPVSLVAMYQGWVTKSGIRAYSHTALAHFGWSLVAAAACAGWVSRRANRDRAAMVVSVAAGLLAAAASFTNDRIVDDMRTEAGRWRVLDHVLALNRHGPRAPAIVVPRLANGSWYTVVAPTYWSEWTKARYGDDTSVLTSAKEAVPEAWLVDYAFDLRSRSFVGLVAATPGASQVHVFSEAAEPGGLELLATDAAGRTSRHPLGPPMRDGRLSTWVIQVPAAVTVRLEGAALDSRRRVLGLDLPARRVLN